MMFRRSLYLLGGFLLLSMLLLAIANRNWTYHEIYECKGVETYKFSQTGDQTEAGKIFLKVEYYRWFVFWAWGYSDGNAFHESNLNLRYFDVIKASSNFVFLHETRFEGEKGIQYTRGMLSKISGSYKMAVPQGETAYLFEGTCIKTDR